MRLVRSRMKFRHFGIPDAPLVHGRRLTLPSRGTDCARISSEDPRIMTGLLCRPRSSISIVPGSMPVNIVGRYAASMLRERPTRQRPLAGTTPHDPARVSRYRGQHQPCQLRKRVASLLGIRRPHLHRSPTRRSATVVIELKDDPLGPDEDGFDWGHQPVGSLSPAAWPRRRDAAVVLIDLGRLGGVADRRHVVGPRAARPDLPNPPLPRWTPDQRYVVHVGEAFRNCATRRRSTPE